MAVNDVQNISRKIINNNTTLQVKQKNLKLSFLDSSEIDDGEQ